MENPFDLILKKLDFQEEMLQKAIEKLKDAQKETKPPYSQGDRIGIEEAAELLGRSASCLYRKTSKRNSEIPFKKIEGRLMFSRQKIEEFINKIN